MSNYLMKMIMSSASEAVDPWYIPLTFTAEQANSTVKLTKSGYPTVDGLQYRIGTSGEWLPYTIDTVITLANVGDIIQFQNTNENLSTSSYFVKFIMTGKIAASGNVQSMLNYINYCNNSCFKEMFRNCSALTQAPELPATTLANNCYEYMFRNCSALTQAPELPATNLANSCYYCMFEYCSALTQAPELPATTLKPTCYSYMFNGCSALTQAPELPATVLVNGCYSSMFRNCSALTQAPELPATTLADNCYESMFNGCSALTQAPELPATILDLGCYKEMFKNCSSLNYINCNFSDWKPASLSTNDWVQGVSAIGTFIGPSNLSLEYGQSRIPNGWEVIGPEGINAEDQTYSLFVGEEINRKLTIYTNPSNYNVEVVEGTIPTGLEITSDGYLRGSVTEEVITHLSVKITIPGTTYEKIITINVEAYATMAYDPVFYFPCINENVVYVKNMYQSLPLYFKQLEKNYPVTFSIDDEGIRYAYIATQTSTYSMNRTLQAQNLTYNRFFDNYTGDWSAFYRVKLVESFTSGTRNLICLRYYGPGASIRIGLKVDETAGFMFLYIDNYNGGDDNNGYTFGSRADRAVEVGQWYDIAITYNSTNKEYKFYMNKVHKTTSYESLNLKISSGELVIGSYTTESNWNKTVASQLSDITFWDKCLTDEEVQSL